MSSIYYYFFWNPDLAYGKAQCYIDSSMVNPINDRRKQFLISKSLQLRYMTYFAGLTVIISAVIVTNLYFEIWNSVLETFSNPQFQTDMLRNEQTSNHPTTKEQPSFSNIPIPQLRRLDKLNEQEKETFKEILNQANSKLFKKLVPLLILLAIGSIFISHRIAGPLYHFQIALEAVSQGDLRARVHLRKFDEAQFLAHRFNRTIQNLDFTLSRLKIVLRENESQPERLKTRLQEELSKFKTSADR